LADIIPHPALAFDLLLGGDTEFVLSDGRDVLPEERPGNDVLCYSYAVLNPRTGKRFSGVYHLNGRNKRHRVTFPSFIAKILAAAEKGGYIDTPDGKLRTLKNDGRDAIHLLLAAHFSRADLPGFKDFPSLKKRFDGPRGTFATTNTPAVFDVRLPGSGRRRRVSVTLADTKLLAPATCARLKDLGDALGFPKLSVPDVIDETGKPVKGITRMDLVRERHPEEFDLYARRDSEVALAWWMTVGEYAQKAGLSRVPATLGAVAVKLIMAGDAEVLASVLGRALTAKGTVCKQPLYAAAAYQALFADTYHGGRNECFAVGDYGPEDTGGRVFMDLDLAGAYTAAMAFCRPIDWENLEPTKEMERLATSEAMTYASITFRFPDDVRFPSLACDSGDYGLIFPRSGSTAVTGLELMLALNQGAKIEIHAGVRLPFKDADGPRPFAVVAQIINKQRAAAREAAGGKSKSPLELLAKEVGNSGYGKTAQAVGAMKSSPVVRKPFNPRKGCREEMGPSAITAPHVASYTAAIVRVVVSEILHNAPADALPLSLTTDGLLSAMDMDTAKSIANGVGCAVFMDVRSRVDANGSPEFLEKKHAADRVLSVKTRGNFTIEPAEIKPGEMSEPLCARVGHRLEAEVADRLSGDKPGEVREWLKNYAEREYDTRLVGCEFACLQDQWTGNSDLVQIEKSVRMNFDYDMKRRPVNVRTGPNGLIKFETDPWDSLDEFLEWRRDFDAWRIATRSVLKKLEDWQRFVAWRTARRTRSASQRTPWQQRLVALFATGKILPLRTRGRGGEAAPSNALTQPQIAKLLSDAGVPAVTRDIFQKVALRESSLAETLSPPMLSEDFLVLENLRRMLSPEVLKVLASNIVEPNIDDSSILLRQPKTPIDSALKDKADTPLPIENNLIAPKSVEGRVYLAHLKSPEITPSTASENAPAGAREQTPVQTPEPPVETTADTTADTGADTPAETNGAADTNSSTDANGTTDAPPPPPPTRPADPRYDSPALTRAMDAIVPVIETRLRRQGVTSKHIRLGRAAAIADGETEADLPMATLVHALAIREGLPVEFAVAMISGMVSEAVTPFPQHPTTTRSPH
jgi:hypothetical protein